MADGIGIFSPRFSKGLAGVRGKGDFEKERERGNSGRDLGRGGEKKTFFYF